MFRRLFFQVVFKHSEANKNEMGFLDTSINKCFEQQFRIFNRLQFSHEYQNDMISRNIQMLSYFASRFAINAIEAIIVNSMGREK